MKRIISLFLALMLVSFCLGITALADSGATISDDATKMYYNGQSYSRVNAGMLIQPELNNVPVYYSLSEGQITSVQSAYFYTSQNQDVLAYATITYIDGSTLSVTFIKDSVIDEYNAIISGKCEEYSIDFTYPEGNTVKAKRSDLFGEEVTLEDELALCDSYYVYAQDNTGSVKMVRGALLISDEDYYYVDFAEAEIANISTPYLFQPGDYESLKARHITDEDLCEDISEAEEKYYSDEFGFLYDDELTQTISAAAVIIALVILPLAILILFLVFAIRSKGFYRKMYITVCATAGSELIIISVIYALLNL